MSQAQVIMDDDFIKSVKGLDKSTQIGVWKCVEKLIKDIHTPHTGLEVKKVNGNKHGITVYEARINYHYRLIFEKVKASKDFCRLLYADVYDPALKYGENYGGKTIPNEFESVSREEKRLLAGSSTHHRVVEDKTVHVPLPVTKQGTDQKFQILWQQITKSIIRETDIKTLAQNKTNFVAKVKHSKNNTTAGDEEDNLVLPVLTDKGLRDIPVRYLKVTLNVLIEKGKLTQKELPGSARYFSAFVTAYLYHCLGDYLETYREGRATGIRFKQ